MGDGGSRVCVCVGGPLCGGVPRPHPLTPRSPSYAQRLELLVLKEEFFPRLSALRTSIQTLTAAAAGERHRGVPRDGGCRGGMDMTLPVPAHPSAAPQSCWSARSCTPSFTSSSAPATT